MMDKDFQNNINTVREIYPGVYRIVLNFASKAILEYLIEENYGYLWFHNYKVNASSMWTSVSLPISDNLEKTVLAKDVCYDFIVETKEYASLKNELYSGITLIQVNKLPPDFIDLNNFKGKTRYELLSKECDYLFEVTLPSATDYGILISSDLSYLKSLLNNPKINWSNLP